MYSYRQRQVRRNVSRLSVRSPSNVDLFVKSRRQEDFTLINPSSKEAVKKSIDQASQKYVNMGRTVVIVVHNTAYAQKFLWPTINVEYKQEQLDQELPSSDSCLLNPSQTCPSFCSGRVVVVVGSK